MGHGGHYEWVWHVRLVGVGVGGEVSMSGWGMKVIMSGCGLRSVGVGVACEVSRGGWGM